MASNPMQRKIRNSFLLGILVMLVITSIIAVLVFFAIIKPKMDKEKEEEIVTYAKVCQLVTDVTSGQEINNSMIEFVELPVTSVPNDAIKSLNIEGATIARVNLGKGTILSSGLIAAEEQELDKSLRTVEYNMITLPVTLQPGEIVDIRLSFANGQDLIVLSKKKIEDVYGNTIVLNLTESEILMMNSAIVEAYVVPASNLHMAKYTNAGEQEAANPTYVPTQEVQNLIKANRNITEEAKQALANLYVAGLREYYIDPQVNQYNEDRQYNVEAGIQKQIEAARKAREDYLSGLQGY